MRVCTKQQNRKTRLDITGGVMAFSNIFYPIQAGKQAGRQGIS